MRQIKSSMKRPKLRQSWRISRPGELNMKQDQLAERATFIRSSTYPIRLGSPFGEAA